MRSLFLGLLIPFSVACGAGTSTQDVERSMAQFRLAGSLHQEGNTPAALARLNEAIRLDDENGEAYLLRGWLLLSELHRASDAEADLRKGIGVLEAREASHTLAEAHNMLGLSLLEQELYDEAIAEFERSAADVLNQQPATAWANLGRAYFEMDAFDDAIAAYLRAVELNPQFCVAYFLLGQTYFAQEQFEEAETVLSSAIESHPACERYQTAYRLRGEVRARLGERDDAVSDLERCVELNGSNEDGLACRQLLDTGT
jgi:tetratricopeptide (TPR) repeat protein